MWILGAIVAVLGVSALLASGHARRGSAALQAEGATGAAEAKPVCAHRTGWRRLADRIHSPVYCPGWLPDPLIGQVGGRWNTIDSVSRDRSYLEGFVWQGLGLGGTSGELHVNLRGYPGRRTIPTCTTGGGESRTVACFAQPNGGVHERGIRATIYTVNQDADEWHVALVWRAYRGLFALSEHVAPPLSYDKVVVYLKHELAQLVVIKPWHPRCWCDE